MSENGIRFVLYSGVRATLGCRAEEAAGAEQGECAKASVNKLVRGSGECELVLG